MLNYEEIKSYYDKGLLDSMRLSLGLPWDKLIVELFSHIENIQCELDSAETELADVEDCNFEIEELNLEIEGLQEELEECKDENLRMKEYIDTLEDNISC